MTSKKSTYITPACLLLLLMMVALQGCGLGEKRSSCLSTKPLGFGVLALITLNGENQNIQVAVYEGTMENNTLRYEKKLNQYVRELWLETNKQYTVIAYYKKDGKTYQVVSGIEMSVSQSGRCYYVSNTVIDLRLKD